MLFVVTAVLDHGGGLERFLVEAEDRGGAATKIFTWLGSHASIRAQYGIWIPCDRVLVGPRTGSTPAAGNEATTGSYLIDGRRVE